MRHQSVLFARRWSVFIGAVFTWVACTSSFALASTSRELRDLLEARSLPDLEQRQSVNSLESGLRDACEAELRAHLLPRSCFSSTYNRSSVNQTHLAKICLENAKASRSRLDLTQSLKSIPESCQRVARERLEDLRYVDSATQPELAIQDDSLDRSQPTDDEQTMKRTKVSDVARPVGRPHGSPNFSPKLGPNLGLNLSE